MIIEQGFYKHYKGGVVEVLSVAIDTKTDKDVVVYIKDGEFYTKPVDEWFDLKGESYRFIKINNDRRMSDG